VNHFLKCAYVLGVRAAWVNAGLFKSAFFNPRTVSNEAFNKIMQVEPPSDIRDEELAMGGLGIAGGVGGAQLGKRFGNRGAIIGALLGAGAGAASGYPIGQVFHARNQAEWERGGYPFGRAFSRTPAPVVESE
jgi:hypothetical protein